MSKITKKQLQQSVDLLNKENSSQHDYLMRIKRALKSIDIDILSDEFNESKPQLKKLDQSVFDGLDERWRFAAVDSDGAAFAFVLKPAHRGIFWSNSNRNQFTRRSGKGVYDASNWQNSLIKREPEPQPKQLDQSVFNNMHERWRFAAIDADGSAHRFNKLVDFFGGEFVYEGDDYREFKFSLIGKGYDASNWRNSLIERDIAKELTGSELCKAMLARGDRYVLCACGDISDGDAIAGNTYDAIRQYRDGRTNAFESNSDIYMCAVPINNQGKPLTASDVGL